MDKNFINIDDLVRLRLGGVEEKERSGSWLNMRELLDKEMPQDRPAGLLYWRRTFSIVAALSVLATVSIGGYEYASSINGRFADNSTVLADAALVAPGNPAAKALETHDPYQLKTAGTVSVEKHSVSTNASEGSGNAMPVTINDDGNGTANNHSPNSSTNNHTAHNEAASNKNESIAAGTTLNHKHNRENTNNTGYTSTTEKKINKNSASDNTNTSSNEIAATSTHSTHHHQHHHKQSTPSAATNVATPGNSVEKINVSGNMATAPTVHDGTAKSADNIGTGSGVASKTKRSHRSSLRFAVKNTGIGSATATNNIKSKSPANSAAGTATANTAANTSKVATGSNTNISKLALAGSAAIPSNNVAVNAASPHNVENVTPATTTATGVKTTGKTATSSKTDTKPGSSKTAVSGVVSRTNTENSVAAINVQKIAVAPKVAKTTPPMDNEALKNVSAMNISKGKKVIERLILHEHFVKTATNEGYFKLDTISMETLTTELGMKSDNTAHPVTTVKKNGPASAVNNGGKADENENDAEGTDATGAIAPAATAKVQAGASLKAAPAAAQKSAGSKMVQKLNETFNDIKYKFGAPKMQMGVVVGVNNTFFGPNSFKGFQFGITGNLVFNDQWSILSEIKYFHRINGNTSIEDNYNTYTPVAGGQFAKQQQLNSYSFSALHSLELPISIRYCMGNFNFFAGGNLVYTFSINTGAETVPVTSATPVLVSAPGADNAPKLSEQDFTSRIGLGYLLGLSYSLGPKTMLDVRSVQTVWDNAATSGAKSISSQLYKSPSLQLSIIYRLGGNKNRE